MNKLIYSMAAIIHSSALAFKIGLIVVATGKYIDFIPNFIEKGKQYFLPNHEVTFFVLTDREFTPQENVVILHQKHMAWPYSTMLRYKAYVDNQGFYSHMDYLFFIDADLLFVSPIDESILGKTVATLHPGFAHPRPDVINNKNYSSIVFNPEDWILNKQSYTYESSNKESTAYLEKGDYYFYGALFGGETQSILEAVQVMYNNMMTDFNKNIIALWHDESHLNWYFNTNLPDKILPPLYAYPDNYISHKKLLAPFVPKILALTKNHSEYRAVE